ncbi:hypothetical protein ACJX0J_027808, partial [Zea mays]
MILVKYYFPEKHLCYEAYYAFMFSALIYRFVIFTLPVLHAIILRREKAVIALTKGDINSTHAISLLNNFQIFCAFAYKLSYAGLLLTTYTLKGNEEIWLNFIFTESAYMLVQNEVQILQHQIFTSKGAEWDIPLCTQYPIYIQLSVS